MDSSQEAWLMRRAVMRLINAKLAAALAQWKEVCQALAHEKQLLKGALYRFIHSIQYAALVRWRGSVVKGQDGRMAGALKRMQQRGLSAAWNTWREQVAAMLAQEQMLRGALARMHQKALSAAWNKWCEAAADTQSDDSRLAGAVLRWIHATLAAALDTWREETQRKKAFLLREPAIQLAAELAWQHSCMEHSFTRWQRKVWEARHSCDFTSKTDLHRQVEVLQREVEALRAEAVSSSKLQKMVSERDDRHYRLKLTGRSLVLLAAAGASSSSLPLRCIERWQRSV